MTVFDGGGITYTDLPYVKEGQGVTLGGVKLHVLSEGSKFDFKTRQIIPPRTQHKAGTATASESGKATSKKQKGRISK